MYPGTPGLVKVPFKVKSAQAFNVTTPCICCFEHSEYRENKLQLQASDPDVTQNFPVGKVPGMSCAIGMKALWYLCTKPGYNGAFIKMNALDDKQEYPHFGLLGINDQVASVEMVRMSVDGSQN